MKPQKEFWDTVTQKYEAKNQALQKRQQELLYKLEAMQIVAGDDGGSQSKPYQESSMAPFSKINFFSEQGGYQSLDPAMHITKESACSCPPQAEKSGGFFKCLMSMLKSKDGLPPPQQDIVPTKDDKRESVSFIKDIPPMKPMTMSIDNANGKCICNSCTLNNPQANSADRGSIPSKDAKTACSCEEKSNPATPEQDTRSNDSSQCICEENPPGRLPPPTVISLKCISPTIKPLILPLTVEKPGSNFSLKSEDLQYLKNIQDLASQEKRLTDQINDLEQKTRIYENVLGEYKTVDFSPKDEKVCTCQNPPEPPDPNEKSTAELKLENFLLKNELKDMRLEVRQYLERMEGPMQFKIESERFKCQQLEQKLEAAARELSNTQEFYQNEINSLRKQLCIINTNIYNLTTTNDQLKQDYQNLQAKYKKMEDDLIRRKINEADTIRRLRSKLEAKKNGNIQNQECDLHEIARELSRVLKECEPCGDCMNLPEDLTAAAKLLKSLTDMIDSKLPKKEDAVGQLDEPPEKPEQDLGQPELNILVSQEIAPAEGESMPVVTIVEAISKEVDSTPLIVEDESNAVFGVKEVDNSRPSDEGVQLPTAITQVDVPKDKKSSCKCNAKKDLEVAVVPKPESVDQIWPAPSERFKVSHQVTADKSKDLLKSETSVKCLKVKENFPFDVDTQVDVLNRPPDGVHVTTTVTKSGTLEVVTEGPEGVIETTLVYTNSGNVEVVTEISKYGGVGKISNLGKIRALPPPPNTMNKAIEDVKKSVSESNPTVDGKSCKPASTETPPMGAAKQSAEVPGCPCSTCPTNKVGTSPSPKREKSVVIQDSTPLGKEVAQVKGDPENKLAQMNAVMTSSGKAESREKVAKSLSLTLHVENPGELSSSIEAIDTKK